MKPEAQSEFAQIDFTELTFYRGRVALHSAAMERGNQLHAAEGKRVRAADVHGVRRRALIGAKLRELVCGDDRRLVPLGEGDRVAQVVAMSVREEHRVEPRELLGSDVGGGITGEEGIDHDALAVALEQEAGMAVKCGFHPPMCCA